MAKGNWVDFREVRERVDFGQILKDYGVEFKMKGEGNQVQAFCPLPGHQGGGKRSPSFSARIAKPAAFQCFSCGAKGNVLDFVALMEGLDPENVAHVRMAALQLQARYLGKEPAPVAEKAQCRRVEPEPEKASQDTRPRIINAPLDFELRGLDAGHSYLRQRRLTDETIQRFGLAYCHRGLMKGRIAIPLHDLEGRLIGYAGRLVEDAGIDADNPKYLFPGSRERDGVLHEFSKAAFVYNAWRLQPPVDDLIVVEGFFSVFWMVQTGWANSVVALMGSTCSTEQAAILVKLVKPSGRLWVIPDGDEAGRRCAESVLMQTADERFVRWIKLEDGMQPEDFYQPTNCPIRDCRVEAL